MTSVTAGTHFEWAQAGRPKPGHLQSGDRAIVCDVPDGVLFAAVDGLGHGTEAAHVAEQAIAEIEATAHGGPEAMLQAVHARLLGSRGVVLGAAFFHTRSQVVEWFSIGDVDLVLFRPSRGIGRGREHVMTKPGVVGYQLPKFGTAVIPVEPLDVLTLSTDGINVGFAEKIDLRGTPHQIAESVVRDWSRPSDDSLILVVRYREGEAA